MTNKDYKTRRKMRLKLVKVMSCVAIRQFLDTFQIRTDMHSTPTLELAAMVKAVNKLSRYAKHAQIHLDKRHDLAKKSRTPAFKMPTAELVEAMEIE